MKKRMLFTVFVLLIAAMACSAPGAAPNSADPNAFNTMVALTNQALPPAPPAVTAQAPIPAGVLTAGQSLAVCEEEACMAAGMSMNYLIVTRPLFADALVPFINWKTGQGFRVGLVTVDWLAARFTGRSMAESMKIGMHTLRQQTGVQYILLVGDTEITRRDWDVNTVLASYTLAHPWNVPTGYSRQLEIDPPGVVVPDDTYFVEERDWDPQNTGLNPRPNQENAVMPVDATLFVGRWPIRKPEEIAPIFAKTQNVVATNRIFFVHYDEYAPAPLEEYLRRCPELPFPEWGCYGYDHASARLFGANSPWLETNRLIVDADDPQQAGVVHQSLSGYNGIILENFHGAYDGLQMPGSDALLSENYPMLVVASCNAFAYYSGDTDTFSEIVIKSPSGPALIASPPNEYLFLMYLRQGLPVGQAFWRSAELSGGSAVLMGDPSLQVMIPAQ